ncbi:hypothetical protein OG194_05060 [Streptomyces sp. NBC_01288]|nr:hypothetical protein OG194_05060 [Streptomyces sp. NBC_01288]
MTIVHAPPGSSGHSLSWQATAAEWEQSSDLVALLEAVQASIGQESA